MNVRIAGLQCSPSSLEILNSFDKTFQNGQFINKQRIHSPSTKTEEKTFYKKNNGLTSPHRERSRVRKRKIKLLLPSSGSSSALFSGFPICRSKIGIETFLSFFSSRATVASFDSDFGFSGLTSLSVLIKH